MGTHTERNIPDKQLTKYGRGSDLSIAQSLNDRKYRLREAQHLNSFDVLQGIRSQTQVFLDFFNPPSLEPVADCRKLECYRYKNYFS
jgi:hypothetical protein